MNIFGRSATQIGRVISQRLKFVSAVTLLGLASAGHAQIEGLPEVGDLIWEDNFDAVNTEYWSIDEGDGCQHGPNLCGWGNFELQWYSSNNVSIQPVPNEPGNSAVVFQARREAVNNSQFTSGKLTSQNKLAVQYGVIETRIRVPSVDTGLWPAAWMLGTTTLPWPQKGEIDMMEMGHRAAERVRQGHPEATPNTYVGSNAIFWAEGACSDANPSCAASTAWDVDYNKPYVAPTSLADRFVIYRTYWTETELIFTIEDNGVETMLYEGPFAITEETNTFRAPFYLLLNLAVGGAFTDAANAGQVTAPIPGEMFIDYVRVYEADGQGEVFVGDMSEPESGPFGVFTETTPVNNALEPGVTSDIFLWDGTSGAGTSEPYEGENVISFAYNAANTWFGSGIQARQALDMSGYGEGEIRFQIKIPADVSFRIGVIDTYTNENWITFPANQTMYGLERDGEWGEVVIPMEDARGPLIALQSILYPFAISSDPAAFPTAPFEYSIDDVIWDDGNIIDPDTDGDSVPDSIDQCPGTPEGTEVDEVGCALAPDTDGDGVADEDDLCPETPSTVVANEYGCPAHIATIQIGQAERKAESKDYWAYVEFDQPFVERPIVVIGSPKSTFNDEDPFTWRVKNVSEYGFSFHVDEWNYLDGVHDEELFTFIAVLPGTHDWNGIQVVAGAENINHKWFSLPFDTSFASTPVVFAQQITDNGKQPTTTRIRNVSATGFDAKLQEEEAGDGNHKLERINYIALSSGMGSINGLDVLVNSTEEVVKHQWYEFNFVSEGSIASPMFLAGMQTTNGGDTATVRYQEITNTSVQVKIQEEQSADAEMRHQAEALGFVVFGTFAYGDEDADGVADNIDACPGTPAGEVVDSVGCPLPVDTDGDGVTDDLDQCPGTLAGVAVDAYGCALPVDSDNDGVVDELDLCPGTSAGAVVDADGCEVIVDEDGDGVNDDVDLCPGTPAGTPVDATGCEAVGGPYGIIRTSDTTAVLYVNTTDWADVHFIVNGGPQQNIRMTTTATRNEFEVSGLTAGDQVEFFFTYWNADLPGAVDSPWETYTH